ncbi:universal stress protein [Salinactinospora qingdaonensis]|uniref:Universal stress protein n=1 Tax=Salinactinospora qingdaonensis TaxID=702744 RepID=A0ABP7FZU9_9ACTN
MSSNDSSASPQETEGATVPPSSSEIVVGVDGSTRSRAALEWAARACADRGLGLVILHALSIPVVAVPFGEPLRPPPSPEVADRCQRLLQEDADHVAQLYPDLPVRTEVSALDPSYALLAAGRTAAMVVVGSRGLGAFASAFLGTVSIRVSAHASCPVAVVPDPATAEEGETKERDGRGRIVVGLDGSHGAKAALRFALGEAARTGAEVVAVHAWLVPVLFDGAAFAASPYTADREFFATHADKHVRTLVDEVRSEQAKDIPIHVEVVEDHAAHALLSAGEDADLIVVGSRGRGGFTGLLLGSVSQAVLHHAPTPVVVVRSTPEDAED